MTLFDPKTRKVSEANHSQIMAFSNDLPVKVKQEVALHLEGGPKSLIHYNRGQSIVAKEDRHGS